MTDEQKPLDKETLKEILSNTVVNWLHLSDDVIGEVQRKKSELDLNDYLAMVSTGSYLLSLAAESMYRFAVETDQCKHAIQGAKESGLELLKIETDRLHGMYPLYDSQEVPTKTH